MKTLSFVLSSLVALACSAPSHSPTARAPLAPLPDAPSQPTSDAVLVATDEPAHVFTPRRHPAHTRTAAAFVDVNRLPRMRSGGCFASERLDPSSLGKSRVPISGGALGGSGSGYSVKRSQASGPARKSVPLAGSGAARPAPAPSAKALPAPAPAQAEAQGYGYSSEDSARGAHSQPRDRAPSREQEQAQAPKAAPAYHDYGASLYLSNDDTMSLSSAQRVMFAIDRFLPIPPEHIRPHELLNYFSFTTAPVAPTNDFSVYAEVAAKPGAPGIYTLGLSISGRDLRKDERRNAALTFVIDRSGSMSDEGRMDYLKRGLMRMTRELKQGDLVNLVLFDHEACTPLENFVVGRDPIGVLTQTIDKLAPRGSTDVDSGLRLGYSLADKGYQPSHSNRVVLITDALANTGVTDPELISMISSHYDKRRIRLSGVGVGTEFNDGLLDRLTERGKGAYVFLGSASEVDAVFGDRFVSLIETTANDVHFKLALPPSLRMNVFYGEESSTAKEDVQAIHYFAGTSQLFLSDLMSRTPELRAQDSVMLSIEYENPETGQPQFEDFAFNLGELARSDRIVRKGRLVLSFIDGLSDTVRSLPIRSDYRLGGWVDASASEQCRRGSASLAEQSRGFAGDAEVQRVVELWDKYCSRYDSIRAPVRRAPPRGADVWPSAQR